MIVFRLVSVLLWISAYGGAASAQIESAGFEAADGWDAGYSICGPEFAATCSYPITNACVSNDHVANQNCCEADPNEDTGWFMADHSRHCNEPHIDTANPFSGLQHLRFQLDPLAVGNATAYTPRLAAQAPTRTVISAQIAGSNTGGSLKFFAIADDDPIDRIAADVVFRYGGTISVYDFLRGGYIVRGRWLAGGVYQNLTIDLDPARHTVRYCYGGRFMYSAGFEPNQARTVQRAILESDNVAAVWDIDDYTVTRGGPAPTTCAFFATTCAPGPCASLVATGVNGEPIPATRDVYVRPGDLLEAELRFSGWAELVNGVRVYEAQLNLLDGAVMGASGTVLPLGWAAPVTTVFCTSNADCPSTYPICMSSANTGTCVGLSHNPGLGLYIDISRPDFILSGLEGVFDVVTAYLGGIKYFGVAEEPFGVLDQGVPRYAGTLMLNVSEDACGTFGFRFYNPNNEPCDITTFLADPSPKARVLYPFLSSLQVHVCEDDGLFCNGLESCESGSCVVTPPPDCDDGNECTDEICDENTDTCGHVAVCGACCDSWIGECQNAVDQADCACPNCVWTGGVDCADIECKAEFVVIPAVSQWGLVVLTLLLLTGGKVVFGRRSAPSHLS